MSGTGSPSVLACHQSLSKGSLLSPASKGKAEKTSSQELSGGQHAHPHLTSEQFPWRERPALDRRTSSPHPHAHTRGCSDSRSNTGSAQQAPPVFLPHHEKAAMSSHEKPRGRNPFSSYSGQMLHRSGASFVNDFKVYLSTPRRLLEFPTAF